MRRIALCLLAVTALGAGGACGGDSGKPLTAEEFATQANVICKTGDAKLAEAGNTALKDATTPEKRVDFMREHIVGSARYKIKEIGKLNPPKKDEDKVKKMLAAGKKAADSVEEGLKKQGIAFQGQASADQLKEFDKLARDLKLTDCASQG